MAADMTEVSASGDPDGESAELGAALAHPVLFRLDERCRIREIGVLPDTPAVARRKWQLLLTTMEFELPPGGA